MIKHFIHGFTDRSTLLGGVKTAQFWRVMVPGATKTVRRLSPMFNPAGGRVNVAARRVAQDLPKGLDYTGPMGTTMTTSMPLSGVRSGGNVLRVKSSVVPPELRGQGRGVNLYQNSILSALGNYQKGQGPRFFASDTLGSTSDQARHVWEALRRRGYPIRVNRPPQYQEYLRMQQNPAVTRRGAQRTLRGVQRQFPGMSEYSVDLGRMGKLREQYQQAQRLVDAASRG